MTELTVYRKNHNLYLLLNAGSGAVLSLRLSDAVAAGQCVLVAVPVRSLQSSVAAVSLPSGIAHDLSIDFAYEKSTKEKYASIFNYTLTPQIQYRSLESPVAAATVHSTQRIMTQGY